MPTSHGPDFWTLVGSDCSVGRRMSGSALGLYPPDARCIHPPFSFVTVKLSPYIATRSLGAILLSMENHRDTAVTGGAPD